MALRADDVQATGFQDHIVAFLPVGAHGFDIGALIEGRNLRVEVATQHDIGATASHVGGNRDHSRAPGVLHDVCLSLVLLRVQYLVLDLALLED